MICPKCRKNYPDSTEECPNCGVQLIGLMGDADAVSEDDVMEKIVVDSNGEFAPTVIYRNTAAVPQVNIIAVIILVIAILFLAASVFCFVKGKNDTEAVSASIQAVKNSLALIS